MRSTRILGILLLAVAPAAIAEEPRAAAASAPVQSSAPLGTLPPAPPVEDASEPPPPGLVTTAVPRAAAEAAMPLAEGLDDLRWMLGRWTDGTRRVTARRGPGGRSILLETAGRGASLDIIAPARDGEGLEVFSFPGDDAAPSVTTATADERSLAFRRAIATDGSSAAVAMLFERPGAPGESAGSGSTAARFRKE